MARPVLPLCRAYRSLPSPQFDAVEDVKAYFGPNGWPGISKVLQHNNGSLQEFIQACTLLGILDGFQVRSLWDLYKGGNAFNRAVSRFHGGLLEASRGWYEDDATSMYEAIERMAPGWSLEGKTAWIDLQCNVFIIGCTDRKRLEVYLEWNGIIGYTETIWNITQGDV